MDRIECRDTDEELLDAHETSFFKLSLKSMKLYYHHNYIIITILKFIQFLLMFNNSFQLSLSYLMRYTSYLKSIKCQNSHQLTKNQMLAKTGQLCSGVGLSALSYCLFRSLSLVSSAKAQPKVSTIEDLLKEYNQHFVQSRILQKMIPRSFRSEKDLQNLTDNLYYRKEDSHLDSLTKALSEPIWDLLDRGGKRWRPVLCMLIAELFGRKKEEVFEIAALCQIVHNGSLIIDDVEDDSLVRRNKPCIHSLYGVDISLNAGNFMYYAPMLYLLKHQKYTPEQSSRMSEIYIEEMVNLHIGQGWDILWHNLDKLDQKYPTEEQYCQMTAHKTGVLARLSSRLVCEYLGVGEMQTKALMRFAETMGVAFQIQDDLLNLQGEQFKKTKGYNGEDIHEGKISLMVIHFLQNSTLHNKQTFLAILKSKTTDKHKIETAIGMLRASGSLQYSAKVMQRLVEESWSEVQKHLPDNSSRNLLHELSLFGIRRSN